MIGFQLTEEQEQMRQLAHRFAEEEIRSVAGDYDESEEMPWPVIEIAAQIGLTSFHYPEVCGGGGVDSLLTTCIVAEELAWGCLGIGMSILTQGLAAIPILLAGNEQQKSRYIPWFCDTPGKRSAPALRGGARSCISSDMQHSTPPAAASAAARMRWCPASSFSGEGSRTRKDCLSLR